MLFVFKLIITGQSSASQGINYHDLTHTEPSKTMITNSPPPPPLDPPQAKLLLSQVYLPSSPEFPGRGPCLLMMLWVLVTLSSPSSLCITNQSWRCEVCLGVGSPAERSPFDLISFSQSREVSSPSSSSREEFLLWKSESGRWCYQRETLTAPAAPLRNWFQTVDCDEAGLFHASSRGF